MMSVITIIQIVAYIYYIRYLSHMKKYFGEKKRVLLINKLWKKEAGLFD